MKKLNQLSNEEMSWLLFLSEKFGVFFVISMQLNYCTANISGALKGTENPTLVSALSCCGCCLWCSHGLKNKELASKFFKIWNWSTCVNIDVVVCINHVLIFVIYIQIQIKGKVLQSVVWKIRHERCCRFCCVHPVVSKFQYIVYKSCWLACWLLSVSLFLLFASLSSFLSLSLQ